MSTSVGSRVQCSMAYLATMAGVVAAPQATMKTLLDLAAARRRRAAARRGRGVPSGLRRSSRVSATAPGLLVDLLGHEVVVAALLGRLEVPVDRAAASGSTSPRRGWSPGGSPGRARPPGRRRGRRAAGCRPSRAGMSEASRPSTRRSSRRRAGTTRRAATIVLGLVGRDDGHRERARAAWPARPAAPRPGTRPPPRSSSTRWARTSVSVSETSRVAPARQLGRPARCGSR